jgi:DNA-binding CsgD family transcriptional regulator
VPTPGIRPSNLCVLLLLVGKYVELNLMQNLSPDVLHFLRSAAFLLVILFVYGMVRSFLHIVVGLVGKPISKRSKIWIYAVFCFLLLCLVVKFLWPARTHPWEWLDVLIGLAALNIIGFEIAVSIGLIKFGKKCEDKAKAKIIRIFGCLYISRYGFMAFLFLTVSVFFHWEIPEHMAPFIAFLILLYFNLIPFIWLKYIFPIFGVRLLESENNQMLLEVMSRKYSISQREKEILKLLLDGKSNKEIEDELFISYHTVKNHVYNLYQKLGVKTRYELVHLVTKLQKEVF